jgi:hypothetical protein
VTVGRLTLAEEESPAKLPAEVSFLEPEELARLESTFRELESVR